MAFLRSKPVIIVLILLAVGAVGFAGYKLLWSKEQQQPPTVTRKSANQDKVKVTTATTENSKTQKDSSVQVAQPSGIFVSNHKPNLDGNPAPNSMNSTCRTNPGISCEIQFSKDGVTKTLGPDKTGPDGLVSWDWTLQDIGLTQGSWQVTAVAFSGDKSESAKDQVMLEVGP